MQDITYPHQCSSLSLQGIIRSPVEYCSTDATDLDAEFPLLQLSMSMIARLKLHLACRFSSLPDSTLSFGLHAKCLLLILEMIVIVAPPLDVVVSGN